MSSTLPKLCDAAKALVAWREFTGLSQRKFAEYIGISPQMQSFLENGSREAGLEVAVRIQTKSAEFALQNSAQIQEAGLKLPIRCEDW